VGVVASDFWLLDLESGVADHRSPTRYAMRAVSGQRPALGS
jgi:hypothetical protein